jgi:hypothetical protein
MKNRLVLLAVLFFSILLLAWSGHARPQKTDNARQVWEYKALAAGLYMIPAASSPSVVDQLNQCGADGWELVTVENVGVPGAPSAVYYFKRLKQSTP